MHSRVTAALLLLCILLHTAAPAEGGVAGKYVRGIFHHGGSDSGRVSETNSTGAAVDANSSTDGSDWESGPPPEHPIVTDDAEQKKRDSTPYPIISPPVPAHDSSHSFDVFFLEAPFAKASWGNKMGYLRMYHSGVAFKDTETGFTWGMEYDALNGVLPNATLPNIKDSSISWLNQGGVCVVDASTLDNYWTRINKVATITGVQLEQYLQWADQYNKTHTTYELWTVRESRRGRVFLPSSNCYDFSVGSLEYLSTLGAKIAPQSGPVHHRTFNLYSKAMPTPLADTSIAAVSGASPEGKNIINFYKTAEESKLTYFKMYFGWKKKIIFVNNVYYNLQQRFPFFGTHYETWTPAQ